MEVIAGLGLGVASEHLVNNPAHTHPGRLPARHAAGSGERRPAGRGSGCGREVAAGGGLSAAAVEAVLLGDLEADLGEDADEELVDVVVERSRRLRVLAVVRRRDSLRV